MGTIPNICICIDDSPLRHGRDVVGVIPDKLLELHGKCCIFLQILHVWVRRAPQEALPEPIEDTRNVRVCADDKWQILEGAYTSCEAARYLGLRVRHGSLYGLGCQRMAGG